MTNRNKNHLKTIFIVLGILGLLFGGLAYLANPEEQQPSADLVSRPQLPLDQVLARMSADKVKDAGFGRSNIKAQSEKMRAAQDDPEFRLGPFEIGMTYQDFLGATAGLSKILAVKHGVMGVYAVEPDRFNVYFPKAEDQAQAIQMSYHRVLSKRKLQDVIDYLALIWGKPTDASCKPVHDEPGDLCAHTWWPVNGVRLEAKIRATERDQHDRSKIDLSVDAFDDLYEKRAREKAKEQKKPLTQ